MNRTSLSLTLLTAFTFAGIQAQSPFAIDRDLVYGQAEGVDLKLDLVRPAQSPGPLPLVVCVHGGAWQSGTKAAYGPVLQMLAMNGYAAASVEYRMAPQFKFPAQAQDVRRAVEYLRGRAAELKLNADRIAVLGDSAGGHLALFEGLTDATPGIRAVVNLYGVTDLTRWQAAPEGEKALGMNSDTLLERVFGTCDRTSKTLRTASPLYSMGKARPAILTFHGDADPLVKLEQAQWLHEALRKGGFDEKLVVVKSASHGFQGPDLDATVKATVEFLAARLK